MSIKQSIDQFIRRVSYAKNVKRIDSLGSHAGSPFYFYCDHCGVPTEAFPEEPLFPTTSSCSQCSSLDEQKVLDKAKKAAEEFFSEGVG